MGTFDDFSAICAVLAIVLSLATLANQIRGERKIRDAYVEELRAKRRSHDTH